MQGLGTEAQSWLWLIVVPTSVANVCSVVECREMKFSAQQDITNPKNLCASVVR
jgi:hypothetical protein